MIYNKFIILKFEIFSDIRSGAIAQPFREIAHKIAKSKYFSNI